MQGIMKKTFVLLIAAMVITAGFGLTLEPASAVTGPTSITLKVASGTGTSAVVDISGKVKVYVSSVYPSTRSKSVTWSIYSGSSYGKLVNVSSTYCYVQGIKSGTMTIKAKSKYYPYSVKYIKVYVKQLYPTGVTLNKASLNMWAGKTYPLTATVTKASWVYSAGVTWTTNSSGVATVDTAGKVGGVSAGTATITATSKDKSTLKDTCPVNVYNIAMTTPGRINLLSGASMENPVVLSGPNVTNITPARTVTYTSSNPSVVAVDASTGKITASDTYFGSATITATVSMDSITSVYKTKSISYPVNIKEPVGVTENEFTIDGDWGYVEVIRNSDGFLGDTEIVLNKSQLDDLFGYGTLGIDLWNPMDMYLNFQAMNFSLQGGDFSFNKENQTDPTIADVEVLAKLVHMYWLDDTADDQNAVDLTYDGELVNGYSLKFYYDETLSDTAYDQVSLLGNVLTLKFDTVDLTMERLATNKIQLLADTDSDINTAMVPVMTILRTTTGYVVTINDADYMDAQGIDFSLYETYL